MDLSTLPVLIETRKTAEYRRWEDSLHDVAAAAIDARIKHLQHGKKGDWRAVGERRVRAAFFTDGTRLERVFSRNESGHLILLLLGGNKSSQQRDIRQAQTILRDLKARQAALKKAAAASTGARKK